MRSRWLPVVLACFCVLAMWPLWSAPTAALSDWPNHVARVHVLAHQGSSAALASYYEPAWGPYPNLGFDLFGVGLAKLLPSELVGRLFLSLVVFTWVGGVCLFGRAVEGKPTLRVLIASCFVYSESFLLGYANFVFGLGLAMATLGLAFQAAPLSRARRALVALLALMTAVSHAAAIVTLGLGAVAFLFARSVAARRMGSSFRDIAVRAALFVPAGAYFGSWLAFIADHGRDRAFSGVRTSVRLLFGSLLPTYSENADVAVVVSLAVIGLLALGTASRRRLSRRLRPLPALAAGLCLLAVFLAPADYAGSYEANGRYVVGAWTFGLFAVRARPTARARSLWKVLAVMAVTVLFARQLVVGVELARLSRELSAQARVIDALPSGARHLGGATFLDDHPSRARFLRERALLHAVALGVIHRQADVPMLYAIPGVQPLRHRESRWNGHRIRQSDPSALDIPRVKADLDALMICGAPSSVRDALMVEGRSAGVVGACELIDWSPSGDR